MNDGVNNIEPKLLSRRNLNFCQSVERRTKVDFIQDKAVATVYQRLYAGGKISAGIQE
jgi:hypothetical protein